MVFYQKYRPQSLSELIGQANINAVLGKAFTEGRLSHAYLFCGPRGTGKTSTARILAKMINCEVADKAPCNECNSCLSITNGSNLDLVEIDAASNRGIDDIRSLRENIKLSPTQAKKKVYIIDEVHMLSNEAFNALLKTLEEPPAHVIFILATTEEHKIPVTILSRVQKLDFQLGSVKELMAALQRVVDGEKIEIEEDALRAVAKRAEGSFRDGTKILDQLAARGEKITVDLVDQALNSGSFNQLLEMVQALGAGDTKLALSQVAELNDRGLNLKEYVLSLTEIVRYLFLISYGSSDYVKENLGPARFEKLNQLVANFESQRLVSIIKCLQDSLEKMKSTSLPILALEVAIVQCCQKETEPITRVIYQQAPPVVVAATRPIIAAKKPEPEVQEVVAAEVQTGPTIVDDSSAILQDKWTYVLETIRAMNYSLEALLRAVSITGCEQNIVTIEVPYSFHQRILEAPKNRELIESVLSDVLSRNIRIATVLGERPVVEDEVANIEVAEDDEIIRVAAEIFSSDPVQMDNSNIQS